MSANRYGNILTIILIVLVLAILIGIGIFAYNYIIKPHNQERSNISAIEEFDRVVEEPKEEEPKEEEKEHADKDLIIEPTEREEETSSSGKERKKFYHEGFVALGTIKIAKTNVSEFVLDSVTPEALDKGVARLYPSSAQLNQPGNVVIIGHNYKNGTFFSNNKKLSVGDKIKIKDNTGKELTYTIYKKFETTPEDTSFYGRDTNGAIEITLSSCTDDVKNRIIILARVEQ